VGGSWERAVTAPGRSGGFSHRAPLLHARAEGLCNRRQKAMAFRIAFKSMRCRASALQPVLAGGAPIPYLPCVGKRWPRVASHDNSSLQWELLVNYFIHAFIILLAAGLPSIAWADLSLCSPALKRACAPATPTACMTPPKNLSEPMTAPWIKAWVDEHNKVRASVVDALPPLPKVQWSDELSKVASIWASIMSTRDHLALAHDECRITPAFNSVGQNMNFRMSTVSQELTTAFVPVMVKTWADERKIFPGPHPDDSDSLAFRKSSHYAQLVWRKTTHIGCAVARYSNKPNGLNFVVVCNYGPAGVVMGERTY
jgi:hypothetical protein